MMPGIETIGGFASAAVVRRAAAGALRRKRMRPSEAAEKYRHLNNPGSYVGPWRNAMAPYLVEPMDSFDDRATELGVMVGPSQFGKTEIPINAIVHGVKIRPADMLVFQPTRDLALDFTDRRIDEKLLETSPKVKAELGASRGDDKGFQKRFKNSLLLTVAWPSSAQVSSRSVPIVVIDERDSMPDDIGGEGDPVMLLLQRVKTFGPLGYVYVSSSPKRLGRSGIVVLYDQGDRRLWFVPCPDCGEYFAPGFDLRRRPLNVAPTGSGGFGGLHWREGCSPDEARETVTLICPHHGCVIEERHKAWMNDRGTWLPAGQAIDREGRITGPRPTGRTRSWWFCGVMSNFASWGVMADRYRRAEIELAELADDTKLKAVVNTDFGFPYVEVEKGAPPLDTDTLQGRSGGWPWCTVPAFAEFLVATVDVQADRFEVAVWAYDRRQACGLVDRFAIRQLDDGRTDVRPAEYPEHWSEITRRVLSARYPLAENPAKALRVALVAVDSGGLDGVALNAYDWQIAAVAGGVQRSRVRLVKGAASDKGPLVSVSSLDRVGKRRKGRVDLHMLNVSELKKVVHRRLRRASFGPGAVMFPAGTPASVYSELLAERLVGGSWEKQGHNETLDLAVYAAAMVHALRPHKWRRAPWFCTPVEHGAAADQAEGGADDAELIDDLVEAADAAEAGEGDLELAPPDPAVQASRALSPDPAMLPAAEPAEVEAGDRPARVRRPAPHRGVRGRRRGGFVSG